MMEKKILIVDDEESIRKLPEKAFIKAGYIPVTTGNAEEALMILKKEKIHVIFLDLKLPGMNGIDLCKTIKASDPVSCVYSMTGYSSLFELAECRDAGFEDYFLKPIDLSLFISTAESAFKKLERWKKK